MEKKKYKRAIINFNGDKKLQINFFILVLSMIVLAGLMILLTNLGLFAKDFHSLETYEIGFGSMMNRIILSSVLTLVISTIFGFFIGSFFVRKVVGPMHRLQKDLEEMFGGNLDTPVKFRSDDEFKGLAITAERLRRSLKENLEKGNEDIGQIDRDLKDVIQIISKSSDAEENKKAMQSLRELEKNVESLKNRLAT